MNCTFVPLWNSRLRNCFYLAFLLIVEAATLLFALAEAGLWYVRTLNREAFEAAPLLIIDAADTPRGTSLAAKIALGIIGYIFVKCLGALAIEKLEREGML